MDADEKLLEDIKLVLKKADPKPKPKLKTTPLKKPDLKLDKVIQRLTATKVCSTCNQSKELKCFNSNKAHSDGRHNECKQCRSDRRKKDAALRASEKNRIYQREFDAFKKQFKCSRCGIDDYRVLAFHHLDPTKKEYALGTAFRLKDRSKFELELSKCIPVCFNCHAIIHFELKECK